MLSQPAAVVLRLDCGFYVTYTEESRPDCFWFTLIGLSLSVVYSIQQRALSFQGPASQRYSENSCQTPCGGRQGSQGRGQLGSREGIDRYKMQRQSEWAREQLGVGGPASCFCLLL